MKKALATCMILAVLFTLSMSVPAMAKVSYNDAVKYLENVNRLVYYLIERAQELADIALEQGNMRAVYAIRAALSWSTETIISNAMDWAERNGIPVEHEYITVIVGGMPLEIDPIHILW